MRSDKRLYLLDGMRGVCAISLMFYHLLAWNGTTLFQIGTFGVYLFYVLSGFSMWYVYAPRAMSADMLKRFFAARFARIFPLYGLVCLIAVLARLCSQGSASLSLELFQRFLLNITFLFGFDDPGKTSIIPGGWSIGIEWVFYVLFPLFLLFARRLRVMLALLAAGFIINSVTASALLSGQTLEAAWIPYIQFPTFFVYFAAGITSAEIFMRLHAAGYRFSPILARLIPLMTLLLIFAWPSASAEDYLQGFHVVLLILAAMLALVCGSLLESFTRAEVLLYSFLGEISYSTYLLFFFVYTAVQKLLAHIHPQYSFSLLVMLSATGTLLLAYVVYRYYEMPARAMLNRLAKGEAP